MEAEDDCEEGVQRGQTTLTEFFQTRFKGSTPAKQALYSSKQAALSGAESGPGVLASAAHGDAAVNVSTTPSARNVVQSSVNARLLHRIKSARTVPEPALEEVCCHKAVSKRQSVGVRVLLRQSSPTQTDKQEPLLAGEARPHSLAKSSSQSDWTHLDPAAAIKTVKEAACCFGKVQVPRNTPTPKSPATHPHPLPACDLTTCPACCAAPRTSALVPEARHSAGCLSLEYRAGQRTGGSG
jgi:hypothetical protein